METRMDEAFARLREVCPEGLLVRGPVEGGMKLPCLQLMRTGASLKHEMGSRWRLSESCGLNYYPAAGEDPDGMTEGLLLLAKEIWPAGEAEALRDGDVLRVNVETEEICFLTREEAEKMKKELLTLHLKWREEARKG